MYNIYLDSENYFYSRRKILKLIISKNSIFFSLLRLEQVFPREGGNRVILLRKRDARNAIGATVKFYERLCFEKIHGLGECQLKGCRNFTYVLYY